MPDRSAQGQEAACGRSIKVFGFTRRISVGVDDHVLRQLGAAKKVIADLALRHDRSGDIHQHGPVQTTRRGESQGRRREAAFDPAPGHHIAVPARLGIDIGATDHVALGRHDDIFAQPPDMRTVHQRHHANALPRRDFNRPLHGNLGGNLPPGALRIQERGRTHLAQRRDIG